VDQGKRLHVVNAQVNEDRDEQNESMLEGIDSTEPQTLSQSCRVSDMPPANWRGLSYAGS